MVPTVSESFPSLSLFPLPCLLCFLSFNCELSGLGAPPIKWLFCTTPASPLISLQPFQCKCNTNNYHLQEKNKDRLILPARSMRTAAQCAHVLLNKPCIVWSPLNALLFPPLILPCACKTLSSILPGFFFFVQLTFLFMSFPSASALFLSCHMPIET